MSRITRLAGEDGFTLLELMMVVVIIGILVGIAVASFVVSVSASKKTVCKTNLRIAREEVLVYRTIYDEYPPTLLDLFPEYISKEDSLKCPESGDPYEYDPGTGEVTCPYHTDL